MNPVEKASREPGTGFYERFPRLSQVAQCVLVPIDWHWKPLWKPSAPSADNGKVWWDQEFRVRKSVGLATVDQAARPQEQPKDSCTS